MNDKMLLFILSLTGVVLVLYFLLRNLREGNVDGTGFLINKKGILKNKFAPYIIIGLVAGALAILFYVLKKAA